MEINLIIMDRYGSNEHIDKFSSIEPFESLIICDHIIKRLEQRSFNRYILNVLLKDILPHSARDATSLIKQLTDYKTIKYERCSEKNNQSTPEWQQHIEPVLKYNK